MHSKSRWDTNSLGPMTEATIRELHGAPELARVSQDVYEPGAEIRGGCRQGTGYVLEGKIVRESDEGVGSFEKGDIFVFAAGRYVLRIDPTAPAVVVWAWELPHPFGKLRS